MTRVNILSRNVKKCLQINAGHFELKQENQEAVQAASKPQISKFQVLSAINFGAFVSVFIFIDAETWRIIIRLERISFQILRI